MKDLWLILSAILLTIPMTAEAVYDQRIEKTLKKEFKDVVYLAHNDCYKVMSKSDRGYYGLYDSDGKVIIPATYQKFSFEKSEDGEAIIFAMNPNFKALSSGNLVYTKRRGKILDMGRNEPQYIPGGYLTSYGKPIYDLDGRMVLDCEQTAVQPIRDGNSIKAYRVACRRQSDNQSINELMICDPNFKTLFTLEGIGYLWKVELDKTSVNGQQWKCTRNGGDSDTLTLFFNEDGTPSDNNQSELNHTLPTKTNLASQKTQRKNTEYKEFVVDRFEIDPSDLTARNRATSRTDGNGRKCAVLKVYVDDEIVEAQGNVVGEIRSVGMENWIYMAHDSKQVKLVFAHHYPLLVKFIDYDFPTISEQMTYLIRLK